MNRVKFKSLKSSKQFSHLKQNSRRYSGKYGFFFVLSNSNDKIGYAFNIPKKVIKLAVDRNLVKRRLKAALYKLVRERDLNSSFDFFYVYQNKNHILSFAEALEEIRRVTNQIN
jgi:ribonuclease P protein component